MADPKDIDSRITCERGGMPMIGEPKEPVAIKRRTVRVKPHSYQPTKAEMETPIEIRRVDESRPTVDEFVEAAFGPAETVEDPQA